MGRYVCRAHTAHYFFGDYTRNVLIFTPSQSGLPREKTHWPHKLYRYASFLGSEYGGWRGKHIHPENLESKAMQYATHRSQFTHHQTRAPKSVLSLPAK